MQTYNEIDTKLIHSVFDNDFDKYYIFESKDGKYKAVYKNFTSKVFITLKKNGKIVKFLSMWHHRFVMFLQNTKKHGYIEYRNTKLFFKKAVYVQRTRELINKYSY